MACANRAAATRRVQRAFSFAGLNSVRQSILTDRLDVGAAMKTNIPVKKTISLSMMLMLGVVMANGAAAAAQSKKQCASRDRNPNLAMRQQIAAE
jgi:hypothetical protein